MANQEIIKAFCNRCGQPTKHLVIARRQTRGEIAEGDIYWDNLYEMLECRGCETVLLKHQNSFSEEPGIETNYYPPRVARPSPTWKWALKCFVNILT